MSLAYGVASVVYPVSPVPGEGADEAASQATLRLWRAFAPMEPERRRWALTAGVIESASVGDRFKSAEEVAVITAGCLAVSPAGCGLTSSLLGPGDVITVGAQPEAGGRWLTSGEVYRVSLRDWSERGGHEGLLHLLSASARRRSSVEQRLVCVSRHESTERVADLILSVHEISGCSRILLSQAELGSMLGLRRTTVNASCRHLEKLGAVQTRRGKIGIVDAGILAREACGCRGVQADAQGAVNSTASVGPDPCRVQVQPAAHGLTPDGMS